MMLAEAPPTPAAVPQVMNVWQVLVVIGPGIVAAVLAFLARRDVKELHMIVNSRLSQLLEATSAARFAEGRAEGAAGGRVAQKTDDAESQAGFVVRTNAGPTDRHPVAPMDANTKALEVNTAATEANTAAGLKGEVKP